ncbi:MAG: hypothetical protein KGZ79_01190 [Dethiobacter sp.]|jgi:hypothetical protein|nr:hypothetical protein [Dethiobacter sp.]
MQSAKDIILARLHLMAILPLLEDIIEFDKNAQQLVKGWNGAFQFRLPQAKAVVTLVFTNGLLTVKKENQPRQCAALTFKNARFLNDVFQGKTQKSPRLNLLSLLQLKKILQLDQVLQKLEFYLKPEDDLLNNPDTFEFCVKLALYALAFGLKEIGENDPDLITLSHHMPDGTLEIRVNEDPVVHVVVRGGKFYPARLMQIFCAEVTRRDSFLHPHHNWFISAAHEEKDINETLNHAEEAFKIVQKHLKREAI